MKPLPIYLKWADRVLAEFWQQGDEERRRGLPLSMMCDRNGANVAKSQLGFINFIVRPFMTELSPLLPPVWMQRLADNAQHMENLAGAHEQERISSISKLAEQKWVDLEEGPNTYFAVYQRLLSRDYSASEKLRGRRRGNSMRDMEGAPSQSSMMLTPTTNFIAQNDMNLHRQARLMEYQQHLVNASEDLMNRFSPSKAPKGSDRRDSFEQPAGKKVSFSTQPVQTVAPKLTDDLFRQLCKEWVETILEMELEANAAARKYAGTVSREDGEFILHSILTPFLQEEESDVNLFYELTQNDVDGIIKNGSVCSEIVRGVIDAENSQPMQPKASITFDENDLTSSSANSMSSFVAKVTKGWVSLFDALQPQSPHLVERSMQTEVKENTSTGAQVVHSKNINPADITKGYVARTRKFAESQVEWQTSILQRANARRNGSLPPLIDEIDVQHRMVPTAQTPEPSILGLKKKR